MEEALKSCVAMSYDIIRSSCNASVAFHYTRDDVEKDSLSSILRKYEKLSNDVELVSKIRQLIPARNECAHNALLLRLEEFMADGGAPAIILEMKRVYIEADEYLTTLLEKANSLEDVAEKLKGP